MRVIKALLAFVVVIAVGVVAFMAYAWRTEIAPITQEPAPQFPKALMQSGADLAAIGNCAICHTREGGVALAGGRALETPFGRIYTTNITPDPETGIGRWSEAAFQRAMHEGVDREGRHLYPAFPYDHFTLVSDEDNQALYAYLMTRKPVNATAPQNELPFPLNVRMAIAAWKLLYLKEGRFKPDASKSDSWNRGAYLAEGLSHCGACHTPRGALGAERNSRHFAGTEVEHWYAHAINSQSQAPIRWNENALTFYLRNGWQKDHGVARGPMVPVVENLAALPEADVQAIATYVADQMQQAEPTPSPVAASAKTPRRDPMGSADSLASPPTPDAAASNLGEKIYASACASCHEAGRCRSAGSIWLSARPCKDRRRIMW